MTRGVDAVEDVFDRSGSKGRAVVPSAGEAGIRWCASPGVEEVGWEIGEAGAVIPSEAEVSTSSSINQRETCKAGASGPSEPEASSSSSVDQRETGEAVTVLPSLVEVSASSSIDQREACEIGAAVPSADEVSTSRSVD